MLHGAAAADSELCLLRRRFQDEWDAVIKECFELRKCVPRPPFPSFMVPTI